MNTAEIVTMVADVIDDLLPDFEFPTADASTDRAADYKGTFAHYCQSLNFDKGEDAEEIRKRIRFNMLTLLTTLRQDVNKSHGPLLFALPSSTPEVPGRVLQEIIMKTHKRGPLLDVFVCCSDEPPAVWLSIELMATTATAHARSKEKELQPC